MLWLHFFFSQLIFEMSAEFFFEFIQIFCVEIVEHLNMSVVVSLSAELIGINIEVDGEITRAIEVDVIDDDE